MICVLFFFVCVFLFIIVSEPRLVKVAVWQITSTCFFLPTDLISMWLYSRQYDGTDSYENTVSS